MNFTYYGTFKKKKKDGPVRNSCVFSECGKFEQKHGSAFAIIRFRRIYSFFPPDSGRGGRRFAVESKKKIRLKCSDGDNLTEINYRPTAGL